MPLDLAMSTRIGSVSHLVMVTTGGPLSTSAPFFIRVPRMTRYGAAVSRLPAG
jgi:hypothetical protein